MFCVLLLGSLGIVILFDTCDGNLLGWCCFPLGALVWCCLPPRLLEWYCFLPSLSFWAVLRWLVVLLHPPLVWCCFLLVGGVAPPFFGVLLRPSPAAWRCCLPPPARPIRGGALSSPFLWVVLSSSASLVWCCRSSFYSNLNLKCTIQLHLTKTNDNRAREAESKVVLALAFFLLGVYSFSNPFTFFWVVLRGFHLLVVFFALLEIIVSFSLFRGWRCFLHLFLRLASLGSCCL